MKRKDKWIIVTGMPRGGTTVVGQMMALGWRTATFHEPLNADAGIVDVNAYFDVIDLPPSERNIARVDTIIRKITELHDLRFKSGMFMRDVGFRRVIKFFVGGRILLSWRLLRLNFFRNAVIWKDPFAALITGRASREHRISVVVTIRNPWAVAASFKRMSWGMSLDGLASATQSISTLSTPSQYWSLDKEDPVANAAALWVMVYAKVLSDIDLSPDQNANIHLVDLETLVADPVNGYEELYKKVGLQWTPGISRKIARHYRTASNSGSNLPRSGRAHDTKRDPASLNTYWEKVLTIEERDEVSRVAGPLWAEIADRLGVNASP